MKSEMLIIKIHPPYKLSEISSELNKILTKLQRKTEFSDLEYSIENLNNDSYQLVQSIEKFIEAKQTALDDDLRDWIRERE